MSIHLISLLRQAFAVLSDKLNPLVQGVRDNKRHWLELAQNVQNLPNIGDQNDDTDKKPATMINNNSIYNRASAVGLNNPADASESSNGITNNDIPKIVGKLGRLESHNYFKQNGSICDTIIRDYGTSDEVMDQ